MRKLIYHILLLALLLTGCSKEHPVNTEIPISDKAKIIFIEFGAEDCGPCERMVPVMDSIRNQYGSQIDVIFIDVYKNYSVVEQYNIEMMPTQIFFDTNMTELHRHVGFYPEDSIHIFLNTVGLKRLY